MKPATSSDLTPRTRIEWRVTTRPADFGHEGTPTNWRTRSADVVGTPATIIGRVQDEMSRIGLSGSGTYYRTEFRLAATGQIIDVEEIEAFNWRRECESW